MLSQVECQAYVMAGSDFKPGHPAYHPMCLYPIDSDYLVCINSEERNKGWFGDHVVGERQANDFLIVDATDEEKQRLIAAGYQMIGLRDT